MTDIARLQELADREEIRQIFVHYAGYLDAGDHAGYAGLFARDGVLVAQLGEALGPAAIEALLDKSLGPQVRGHLPPAIHVMNNQQIDVDGDTATTEVMWFYLTTDPDGVPTVLQAGRYTDDLVREDGRWRIKRHEISRAMGRSPMDDPPATRLDALTARVQHLEDREAIWRLFMEYRECLDQRDFKAYAALFTEDGVWTGSNVGTATGPDEIETLLVQTLEVWDSDQERTYHLMTNPVIDVDGDRARAYSNWGYITRGEDDSPVFEMHGHYVDQLVRTSRGWRFARREAYSDIPYVPIEGGS
jgi:uncharacterized protein (TIGR02246 family)